jgi:hypothetical protein
MLTILEAPCFSLPGLDAATSRRWWARPGSDVADVDDRRADVGVEGLALILALIGVFAVLA